MNATTNKNLASTEEISLYSLFSLLLRNWYVLMGFSIVFGVLAITWSIYQPDFYKSTVLMMPADTSQSSLGNLGGLSGVASLAGINLPDNSKSKAKMAIALIKSYRFLSEFINENDLLVPIMAAQGWDQNTDSLLLNSSVYDNQTQTWTRPEKGVFKAEPSLQQAHAKFLKFLNVEQDPESKFYKLSIEYYSPKLSAEWANALVKKLNLSLKKIDQKEASDSIAYLENLITQTRVTELKTVFSTLIEEQVKSKMLTDLKDEYAMKVIDPAIAPELKSKPKRLIIAIVVAFLGGIIGVFFVFIRSSKNAAS